VQNARVQYRFARVRTSPIFALFIFTLFVVFPSLPLNNKPNVYLLILALFVTGKFNFSPGGALPSSHVHRKMTY
jgi:hypothetical protein